MKGEQPVTLHPGQVFYEGPDDVHTVGECEPDNAREDPGGAVQEQGVDAVLPALTSLPPPVATKMTGVSSSRRL